MNRPGKDSQVGRDGVRRKDWHDYEAIRRDQSRSGGSTDLPTTVQEFVLRCIHFSLIHENSLRLLLDSFTKSMYIFRLLSSVVVDGRGDFREVF